MEQLELLEIELKMLLENIERLKAFKNNVDNQKYKPWNSHVVGEFKHRMIALKQRMLLASKITTRDLFIS